VPRSQPAVPVSDRLQSAEVSAVFRSWDDRFGAVLAGLSFATLT
jgi:hypothetical protein